MQLLAVVQVNKHFNFDSTMKPLQGFPPIASIEARILILGSMPSEASLAAGEYYAHPRNHFWRLIAGVTGMDATSPYAEKKAALQASGIAVWDVLHSCKRKGSLDSAIEQDTMVINDFGSFFQAHPHIQRVFFNGSAAEQFYRRLVLPELQLAQSMDHVRLPSSSPANATYTFERKLAQWRKIL